MQTDEARGWPSDKVTAWLTAELLRRLTKQVNNVKQRQESQQNTPREAREDWGEDRKERPSSGFCLIIIKCNYAKMNEIVAAAVAGKDCGLQWVVGWKQTKWEAGRRCISATHTAAQLQLGIVMGPLPQARLSSISQQSPGQPTTTARWAAARLRQDVPASCELPLQPQYYYYGCHNLNINLGTAMLCLASTCVDPQNAH